MGEDITVREIGIYLLNRVEVTLKDDSRAEGILQNIAAETITVEGREIMLSDVADIRLAGELTDYDVMRDTGMIGNFTCAPEACRDAAELELMRYGDFACTVSSEACSRKDLRGGHPAGIAHTQDLRGKIKPDGSNLPFF